ncbi:MAG TPA: sulfite exporter TauE/SafE family protein [Ktedonobacterales bacterium]|jgi:hypothetical protein|nr:sulfite exporter TauE/SafE family protein [Ktedonobacterales bacterium]
MTFPQVCLLFVAAVLGGAQNSVAGGGSFLTLPALIFAGVPPINANATSTVALWPGSLASVGAYRKELVTQRRELIWLGTISIAGGLLGAIVLLKTPQNTFVLLLPFLLLVATLLFAFGNKIAVWVRTRSEKASLPPWLSLLGSAFVQFVIAVYGGFFGGGIGILMLALLAVMGMTNIHAMNALKNVLASCINGIAVVAFIIAGAIYWPQALVMIVGAVAGGYGSAAIARKLDPRLVRRFVIVVGVVMTIVFFVRYYLLSTP